MQRRPSLPANQLNLFLSPDNPRPSLREQLEFDSHRFEIDRWRCPQKRRGAWQPRLFACSYDRLAATTVAVVVAAKGLTSMIPVVITEPAAPPVAVTKPEMNLRRHIRHCCCCAVRI